MRIDVSSVEHSSTGFYWDKTSRYNRTAIHRISPVGTLCKSEHPVIPAAVVDFTFDVGADIQLLWCSAGIAKNLESHATSRRRCDPAQNLELVSCLEEACAREAERPSESGGIFRSTAA